MGNEREAALLAEIRFVLGELERVPIDVEEKMRDRRRSISEYNYKDLVSLLTDLRDYFLEKTGD